MNDSDSDGLPFPGEDFDQVDPVKYELPVVSPSSIQKIQETGKFIYIKPAGKTERHDLLFCLPIHGKSIDDLQVVKVRTSSVQNHEQERKALQQIHERLEEPFRSRFPKCLGESTPDYFAMTGYSRPITLESLVEECRCEKGDLPRDVLVLLFRQLSETLHSLNGIGLKHGDIHERNILFQMEEFKTTVFPQDKIIVLPQVKIIDFGSSNSSLETVIGLMSLMRRLVELYPKHAERDRTWIAFRDNIDALNKNLECAKVLSTAKNIVADLDSQEGSLSERAQLLFEKISKAKMDHGLWVTDEDVRKAIEEAGRTN